MPRDDWVSGVTAADVPRQFMCRLNRARTTGIARFWRKKDGEQFAKLVQLLHFRELAIAKSQLFLIQYALRKNACYFSIIGMTRESVENWIEAQPPGSVFSASDLPPSISRGVRDEMLSRFSKQGRISRLMRGIYAIPEWSKLLQKTVLPGGEAVAKAIARKFGWTIMPCDDAAVNGLGLSTQVPARLVYLSNGPSRRYRLGSAVIEFRHRCLRETCMKGRDSKLVIRGLKGLGRSYATPEVVAQVASRYSDDQWRAICEDSAIASGWISKLLWGEMKRRERMHES